MATQTNPGADTDVKRSPPVGGPALPAKGALATKLPAGPKSPAIVNMIRYARNPFRTMREGLRYGECYTNRMPGQPPIVSFTNPAAIKEIFATDHDILRSGESLSDILGPLIGFNSLLVLDGERWGRERRLMQPPFHGERMHTYAATIRQITNDVIDGWSAGASFSIHSQMQQITLEVIMRVVFGVEEGQKLNRLRRALLRFLAMIDGPAAPFLFFPMFRKDLWGITPWGRFTRHRRAALDILLSDIHRRRAEGTHGRTDVLSMLIEARDEEGEPMSDDELLDEMLTLLGAGHETTATSLAWTFYHALRRPDVLTKVQAELQSVVGTGPVEADHLPKLAYVEAVIDETQRLTPVATAILRRVKAPVCIGGRDIPAGVNVSAPIYTVHHRPDFWPNPERFDPDRFVNARPKPNTFFPFGGGVRRCLGAAFAGYEMKIVLAEVFSRVEMHVAPGYKAKPVLRAVAVGPSGGVPVLVDSVAPRR
ncbi:MAG TPA: cytochrome P450 [Dehalococcoidia bacterium]|nr:cytochrome P450 [Dehalococcoidia bacterium]